MSAIPSKADVDQRALDVSLARGPAECRIGAHERMSMTGRNNQPDDCDGSVSEAAAYAEVGISSADTSRLSPSDRLPSPSYGVRLRFSGPRSWRSSRPLLGATANKSTVAPGRRRTARHLRDFCLYDPDRA